MNVYDTPNVNLNADQYVIGRQGEPLTEEQRAARHAALTGETTPPPRGTRKAKLQAESSALWWIIIAAHIGLIAGEIYLAHKAGII